MMQALRFARGIRLATIAVAVLGLALLFCVMGYGARGVLAPIGRSALDASGAGAADVMALLDMRSPGGRSGGALVQSKQSRTTHFPTGRSAGRPAADAPATGSMPEIALGDIAPALPATLPLGTVAWSNPFYSDEAGSPVADGDSSWEYGGGAWGPAGSLPGGPVVGPVQLAVPEPSTWAMIILGTAVVGASVRRRRRTGVPT